MPKQTGVGFFTKCIILGTILFGSILGYSFVLGHISQPHLGVVGKIYNGLFSSFETISDQRNEINKEFILTTQFNVDQEKSNILNGKLTIDGGYFYSNTSGLTQSMGAENIKFDGKFYEQPQKNLLGSIDIVSNNEQVFIDLGDNGKNIFIEISDFLYSQNILSHEYKKLINSLVNINKSGKYGVINNAESLNDTGLNINQENFIYKIFSGIVSSDPMEYFERNNLFIEGKKYIYNDKWIDYIFQESVNNNKDKISYVINPNICNNFSSIIYQFTQGGQSGIDSHISSCEKNISEFNPFLSLVSQIYKSGDIENGNYEFVISQGTNLDIRLKYANNILQDWSIFFQDKNKYITLSLLGDKFGVNESQGNFNYKEGESSILGNIENGTGKISIHYGNEKKIVGDIVFQNYFLIDAQVRGNVVVNDKDLFLSLSGDYRLAENIIEYNNNKIKFSYNDNEMMLDYVGKEYNFNFFESFSSYIIGFSQKNIENNIVQEGKITYDKNKFSVHYNDSKVNIDMIMKILSLGEYGTEITINNGSKITKVELKSLNESESKKKIYLKGFTNEEDLFSGEMEYEKSDIHKITSKINFPNEEINIYFDIQLDIIKGSKKIDIPTNIEEIDTNIFSMIIIPSFHTVKHFYNPDILFGISSLGTTIGTTLYTQSKGESRKEINEKKKKFIENIKNEIQVFIDQNNEEDIRKFIGVIDKDNQSTGIRVGGEKIYLGDKYIVGKVSEETKRKQQEILGIDGEGIDEFEDIHIAILNQGDETIFQILGFLDEIGSNKKSYIVGNYTPRDFIRYDFSLINEEENKGFIVVDNHLRVGDLTNLGRILEITEGNLFLDSVIDPAISKIFLLGNDSPSLFTDKGKVIINGTIQKK